MIRVFLAVVWAEVLIAGLWFLGCAGMVLGLVARGTVRRVRWVPAVSTGAHTVLLLTLLALARLIPPALHPLAWATLAVFLVPLVLPVTPAGRAWFARGRVDA